MDNEVTLKMDSIELTDRRPMRSSGLNAIKSLEQKLRVFFSEEDGHGSLKRKPPEDMLTAKYFNNVQKSKSSFLDHLDWMAFMTYANYKEIFSKAEKKAKMSQKTKAISNIAHNSPKKL